VLKFLAGHLSAFCYLYLSNVLLFDRSSLAFLICVGQNVNLILPLVQGRSQTGSSDDIAGGFPDRFVQWVMSGEMLFH
jgi:hypothetical protein